MTKSIFFKSKTIQLFFLFLFCCTGMNTAFAQCSCNKVIGTDINSVTLASEEPITVGTPCVKIYGTYIIDIWTFLWNMDIQMGSGAHIIVPPAGALSALVLDQSQVYACEGTMWKGITVQDGGNFLLRRTDISDAQYAVELLDGCAVSIERSNFDRNYVGIYSPDLTSGLHTIDLRAPIIGNEFNCTANLLAPFPNQSPNPGTRSYAGVFINDAIGLSIGNENDASLPNTFINQRNGIIALNSALTIDDANITNAPNNCPINVMSSVFFDPDQDRLNGFGVYVADSPFFEQRNGIFNQCCFGTYVASTDVVHIEDNDYQDDITYGIRLNQLSNFFGQHVISNNTLNDDFRGIEVFNVILPKALLIDNNAITISGDRGKAVMLDNVVSLPIAALDLPIVENNIIEMNGQAGFSSIHLNSSVNVQIVNNSLTSQDPSPFIDLLLITGSQQCAIHDNTISGISTLNTGLQAKNSFANNYCCNTFDQLNEGVVFSGFCDNSQFRQTSFNGSFNRGLRIEASTVIGMQEHAGNLWNGTFSDAGAVHEGVNIQEIIQSQFIVDPFDGNTVPTFNAASNSWFFSSLGQTPNCVQKTDCGIPLLVPEISPGDIKVAQGLNQSLRAGAKWEGERGLFEKLSTHPQLLNTNVDIDNFYAGATGQNLESFSNLGMDIRDLFQIDQLTATDFEQQYTDIQQLLTQIQQNEYLMLSATPSDSLTLIAQKAVLLNSLEQKIQYLTGQKNNHSIIRQQSSGQLQQQNSIITTNWVYESNQQEVNTVLLRLISQDDLQLTSAELTLLENIANQCPLDGGNAVFQARGLLRMQEEGYWQDEVLCNQTATTNESVKNNEPIINQNIEVSPNPAKDQIWIKVNAKAEDQIQVHVFDALGKELMRKTIQEGGDQLSVSSWDTGLYFLRFQMNDEIISTEKITIIR